MDPSSLQTIIEKMEVVRDSLLSSVEEENALEEQAIRVRQHAYEGKRLHTERNLQRDAGADAREGVGRRSAAGDDQQQRLASEARTGRAG